MPDAHRRLPGPRPLLRVALALYAGLSLAACGITAPRHSDGFADLESLGVFDVDRTMSLSIGPGLLRFAARHVDDDPETVQLLRMLDGVRVRTYEIDGDPARVAERIRRMSVHLQGQGWKPVLLVRHQREEMQMLLKRREGLICGLTLLTSDGEAEAVVINLMGEIKPERFSEVVAALDIDAPGVREVRLAEAR